MVKSRQKPTNKVEPALAATKKPLKKGKRDADNHLDIQANPKKQKKELVSALHKVKADEIKSSKKVETSSSESSDSEEEQKKIGATKKPDAKSPFLEAMSESSSEDESSSDEESAPAKQQPATLEKVESESSSSDDESSSDEEPAPEKKQPVVVKKAKAESSSSEEESSSDEESAPVKKQPAAVEKAKAESSSSEDESSSHEQPVVKNVVNVKPVAKNSSSSEDESEEQSEDEKEPTTKSDSDSSEEDSDDEERDDEKSHKKKAKVSSTRTCKQESTSDESDKEESEDEKDSDIEMAEAEQKSNAKEVKTPRQPKTPATHTQGGGKTLFVGNLSYQVEKSDVEKFFKQAGKVLDVRLALYEDGSFRGFAHVEFASSQAAQKALELSGKPLLGRDVRLSLAKEKGGNRTAQSSGIGAGSQSKTIFINGFDASLGENEIKNALRDLFGNCGEVTRIVIPADPETGAIRGMAFIDFKDGIDKALVLNGSEIGGRRIKVCEGRSRGDKSGGDPGSFWKIGRGRDNSYDSFSKRGRGRESSDHFSKRGRGRGSSDRFSKRGRGRFEPIKPSLVDLAQGKKIVFDDE